MKAILHVVNRCWVAEFYRRNAGFFLLVLLGAFAFLRPLEHITLAKYALQLPLVLGVYGGLWALYALKILRFVGQTLDQPDHEILFHLRLLPRRARWLVLLVVQVQLLQPALLYAVFVVWLGYAPGAGWGVAAVVGWMTLLVLGGAAWLDHRLRNPHAEQNRWRLGTWLPFNGRRRYALYFPEHLLRREPVLLGLTKAGSLTLLWGVCRLYPTDDYDERLISLGVLVAAAVQGPLLAAWKGFEDQHLGFVRNLPFSLPRRAGLYLLTAAVLWLPETLVLLRNRPVGVSWGFQLTAAMFGLALNTLFFCSLFGKNRTLEELLPRLFWGVVVGFFWVMFRVPVEGLAVGAGVSAWWKFVRNYGMSESFK